MSAIVTVPNRRNIPREAEPPSFLYNVTEITLGMIYLPSASEAWSSRRSGSFEASACSI
jgi:hypothetical protein